MRARSLSDYLFFSFLLRKIEYSGFTWSSHKFCRIFDTCFFLRYTNFPTKNAIQCNAAIGFFLLRVFVFTNSYCELRSAYLSPIDLSFINHVKVSNFGQKNYSFQCLITLSWWYCLSITMLFFWEKNTPSSFLLHILSFLSVKQNKKILSTLKILTRVI